jgi:hypothetical protein
MTKVEEERANCIFALMLAQKGAAGEAVNAEMDKSLDSLISAARAEGVAEERKRILDECGSVYSDYYSLHQAGREFVAGDIWYYFPASVLAPTKESGK